MGRASFLFLGQSMKEENEKNSELEKREQATNKEVDESSENKSTVPYTVQDIEAVKSAIREKKGNNRLYIVGEDDENYYVAGYPIIWNSPDLAGHKVRGRIVGTKNADGSAGQWFTPDTDFDSPYLKSGTLYTDWEHGYAPAPEPQGKDEIVATIDTKSISDDEYGKFAIHAMKRHYRYAKDIKHLIEAGVVGSSTQAMRGHAKALPNGEITRWGLKRNTWTIEPMDATQIQRLAHPLKSLGYELPEIPEAEAEAGGTPAPNATNAGTDSHKSTKDIKETTMSTTDVVSRQDFEGLSANVKELTGAVAALKSALPAINNPGTATDTEPEKSVGDNYHIALKKDRDHAKSLAFKELTHDLTKSLPVSQQTKSFDQFDFNQQRAFRNFMRHGGQINALSPDEAALMAQKSVSKFDLELMLNAGMTMGEIKNTIQMTVGSLGGWAVPPSLQDGIIEEQGKLTPVLNQVTVIELQNSDSTHVVILDKRPAVFWGGECLDPGNTGMTFKTEELKTFSVGTRVCITRKMLESVNVAPLIQRQITEALMESKEAQYLTGSGVSGPTGVLPNGKNKFGITVVPSGNIDSLTTQGIINLTGALRQPYRANAVYYANRKTVTQIWGLTSPSGDYIWGPAACCKGDALPIIEAECMKDVAAKSFPIIYADWSGYYAVRKPGMVIERFHDSNTGSGKFIFELLAYEGGMPVELWKFAAQQVMEG